MQEPLFQLQECFRRLNVQGSMKEEFRDSELQDPREAKQYDNPRPVNVRQV